MDLDHELQPPIETIIAQALFELSCSDLEDSFALMSTMSSFYESEDGKDELMSLSDSEIDSTQRVRSVRANRQAQVSRWESDRCFDNSSISEGQERPRLPTRKKTNEGSMMYEYVRKGSNGRRMPAPGTAPSRPVRRGSIFVDPDNNGSSSNVTPAVRIPRIRRVSLPSAANIPHIQLLAQPQRKVSRQESVDSGSSSQGQNVDEAGQKGIALDETTSGTRPPGVFTPKGSFLFFFRDELSGSESTYSRRGSFNMTILEQEELSLSPENACRELFRSRRESLASATAPQIPSRRSSIVLGFADTIDATKEDNTEAGPYPQSRRGSVMVSLQEEEDRAFKEEGEEEEEEGVPPGDDDRCGMKYVLSFPATFLKERTVLNPRASGSGSNGTTSPKSISGELLDSHSGSAATIPLNGNIEISFRDQCRPLSGVPEDHIYLEVSPKFAHQQNERVSSHSPKQPSRKESQNISTSELQLIFSEKDLRHAFPNIHRQLKEAASAGFTFRRVKSTPATGRDASFTKAMDAKETFSKPSRTASFEGYLCSTIRSASSA